MDVRSRLGRFAVAWVPTLAVVAAAELALFATGGGAEPPLVERGFDPAAAYIVPDPDRPGGWRTQMFDGTSPERVIPPKRDGVRRVLLFGGSNTGSFPAPSLQWAANHFAPDDAPDYEVWNLGRAGYGSLRVTFIFEQALRLLDPDLVVIYSGHNEFVELGFREELGERLPPLVRSAAGVASHLRTFNALCDALRPDGGAREHNPAPEVWKGEFDRFLGYTYDRTLERFEAYRDNLERMCRLARAQGVDVVIGTVISNPLAPPFSSTLPPDLPADRRAAVERAVATAEGLVPARFGPTVGDGMADRTHVFDWMRRGPPWEERPIPALREWPLPVRGGDRLIPEPDRWSARGWRALEAQAAFFARELTAEERAALVDARDALDEALAIVPDMPRAHFLRGVVLWLLGGEDAAAIDALYAAATFDRAPRKGNDVSNGIVREVAASITGVVLWDAERLYRSRAPDGLIGLELMKDECHLHDRAYHVLMYDLGGFIAANDPARARAAALAHGPDPR